MAALSMQRVGRQVGAIALIRSADTAGLINISVPQDSSRVENLPYGKGPRSQNTHGTCQLPDSLQSGDVNGWATQTCE